MEQIIMGVVLLGIVMVVMRRRIFQFRWDPDRGTWVAIGTGLLAFAISMLLLFLPEHSTAAHLFLYGGIWVGCGVLIPWGYTILIEKKSPQNLGLHLQKWKLSLAINLALGLLFSLLIVVEADLVNLDWNQVLRAAVVLIGGGGLFEVFLFYGFIHLRLEKAFGPLPAILLTAVIYVMWHTGTQLTLEADFWIGALKLLGVGVMYQSVFALTYNLLIIWPLFMGMGVMIDYLVNIGEIAAISDGFYWGLGTIVAMVAIIVIILKISRSTEKNN